MQDRSQGLAEQNRILTLTRLQHQHQHPSFKAPPASRTGLLLPGSEEVTPPSHHPHEAAASREERILALSRLLQSGKAERDGCTPQTCEEEAPPHNGIHPPAEIEKEATEATAASGTEGDDGIPLDRVAPTTTPAYPDAPNDSSGGTEGGAGGNLLLALALVLQRATQSPFYHTPQMMCLSARAAASVATASTPPPPAAAPFHHSLQRMIQHAAASAGSPAPPPPTGGAAAAYPFGGRHPAATPHLPVMGLHGEAGPGRGGRPDRAGGAPPPAAALWGGPPPPPVPPHGQQQQQQQQQRPMAWPPSDAAGTWPAHGGGAPQHAGSPQQPLQHYQAGFQHPYQHQLRQQHPPSSTAVATPYHQYHQPQGQWLMGTAQPGGGHPQGQWPGGSSAASGAAESYNAGGSTNGQWPAWGSGVSYLQQQQQQQQQQHLQQQQHYMYQQKQSYNQQQYSGRLNQQQVTFMQQTPPYVALPGPGRGAFNSGIPSAGSGRAAHIVGGGAFGGLQSRSARAVAGGFVHPNAAAATARSSGAGSSRSTNSSLGGGRGEGGALSGGGGGGGGGGRQTVAVIASSGAAPPEDPMMSPGGPTPSTTPEGTPADSMLSVLEGTRAHSGRTVTLTVSQILADRISGDTVASIKQLLGVDVRIVRGGDTRDGSGQHQQQPQGDQSSSAERQGVGGEHSAGVLLELSGADEASLRMAESILRQKMGAS